MRVTAILLLVCGVVAAIIAFNMDVSIDGSRFANLDMMAQRQNILIAGGVAFIAGIIVWVGSELRTRSRDMTGLPSLQRTGRGLVPGAATSLLGRKVILSSSILALIAVFLPWQTNGVMSGDEYQHVSYVFADFFTALSFVVLWMYPSCIIVSERLYIHGLLVTASACAALWWSWKFYNLLSWSLYAGEKTGIIVELSGGVFLSGLAVILLVCGTVVTARETRTI